MPYLNSTFKRQDAQVAVMPYASGEAPRGLMLQRRPAQAACAELIGGDANPAQRPRRSAAPCWPPPAPRPLFVPSASCSFIDGFCPVLKRDLGIFLAFLPSVGRKGSALPFVSLALGWGAGREHLTAEGLAFAFFFFHPALFP